MAEDKRTGTMIAQEDSKEAAEVMGFMEMLDNHEVYFYSHAPRGT